jgi:AcrR family transcriptional regulator
MTGKKSSSSSKSARTPALRDRQPYHHGDLRSALMAAALTLIGQHGVKGFTLKDAARMAGVSIAAPYRHFADKDALLAAIQLEGFTRFNAALHAAYQQASTAQTKFVELGVAYVRFALEHPAHFRVIFSLENKAHALPLPSMPDASPDGFSLLVEAVAALYPHAKQQQIHDIVLANWSLVHGFALLYLDGSFTATVGAFDPETQLRRTLALSLPASSNPSGEPEGPPPGMLKQ